jgi:hypothetical protein
VVVFYFVHYRNLKKSKLTAENKLVYLKNALSFVPFIKVKIFLLVYYGSFQVSSVQRLTLTVFGLCNVGEFEKHLPGTAAQLKTADEDNKKKPN